MFCAWLILISVIICDASSQNVGEPLFLTPYIHSGDVELGRELARVLEPMEGIDVTDLESYSGFITTNASTESNMFFWFFPATDVDPRDAPVSIWLQGGPGASTLYGLLEINGPIRAVYNGSKATTGEWNPYSWSKGASMLYVDNPVGSGFSYSSFEGLPTGQHEVGEGLYEFLVQFFTLFPQYQPNDFYVFGESFAGKYVPTLAKKIHDENKAGNFTINLAGLGIGNGITAPEHSTVYADYLYQAGFVDGSTRDELLIMEDQIKELLANNQLYEAYVLKMEERALFEDKMGCPNPYDSRMCTDDPEEYNYEEYVEYPTTRKAIHVGSMAFGEQRNELEWKMRDDRMASQKAELEFLLDRYRTVIYVGNFDIVCNYGGILAMMDNLEWAGAEEYHTTPNEVFRTNGQVAGYIKSVQNLRLMSVRNAGHAVPITQPVVALDIFQRFINGTL